MYKIVNSSWFIYSRLHLSNSCSARICYILRIYAKVCLPKPIHNCRQSKSKNITRFQYKYEVNTYVGAKKILPIFIDIFEFRPI